MPDLHDMLTDAVPPAEPGFDEGDVRARVAAAERRQRRVAIGSMLAVVTLIGVLVVPALLPDQPQSVLIGPDEPAGELVPLSQWPSSFEFAGVEVGVYVSDEPDEAMQHRIQLGDGERSGEAALNIEPSDVGEPGNPARQMVVARLWLTCGTDQVVRLQEIGSAAPAELPPPPSTGPTRWLPVGALVEAGQQFVNAQGCVPTAPDGTPPELHNNHNQIHGIAAAIDEAGLATCCASIEYDPVPSASTFDGVGLRTQWGVVVDGQILPLRMDHLSQAPTDVTHLSVAEIAGGMVAVDRAAEVAAGTCMQFTTIQASIARGGWARFESLLQDINCTPEIPAPLQPTAALVSLLSELGVEVRATPYEGSIARADIRTAGIPLEVRSGGGGQVGLSAETQVDGHGPLDPAVDGFGAVAECHITHAIRAHDQAGADEALALAERIASHPYCDLGGVFWAPPGGPLPMPGEVDEHVPAPVFPPPPASEPAQQVADSLSAAGLEVTDVAVSEDAATFEFQPADPGAPTWMVSVKVDGGWPVDNDTELVQLGDGGEVAHLGSGVVVFTCDGVGVRMAGDTETVEIGPVAGLTAAAGCVARPPGLSREIGTDDAGNPVSGGVSIREARLFDAFEALGVERCCGEPSHGGSGAATGMVWEDTEVFIFAGPPMTDDPAYQVGQLTELAGGQADLGDGDGLPGIGFDCGDTNYQLSHDSTNADVQIRAAEALVEQLGCTPRVGPTD